MRRAKAAQQQNNEPIAKEDNGHIGRHRLAENNGEGKICNLDSNFLNKHGYLTPDLQNNQLAEEYRSIKRPLLMHIDGKGADRPEFANIIMVVSALSGEGKTYTTMNLAISIAMEKNRTVLLIDSDVIKPALSESLGLSGQRGLTDILIDESLSITDVMYKTNIPKLSLIPAGTLHSHSTELLSSHEMRKLCVELSSRYPDRIILFDAPPLLLTSHARILAHLAGQIVFVAEAGRTLQHEITEAISQISQDKIIGMVLNKSRRLSSGDYSYGSYGAVSN